MSRPVGAYLFRGTAATLAALLLSAVALAAPRPAPGTPCCRSAGASAAPSCCCMGEDASPDASVGCCRLSVPEEAAPSLTSPAAPVLAAPEASSLDPLLPALPGSLEGHARRVLPRARPAPLFLLYSVFLV